MPVVPENLDRDIKKIKERRGSKAIINGNEEPNVTRIPLNSPALMRITSGGIPLGRVTRLWGGPSSGKAMSLDTLLPTPTGWIRMGEVKIGDMLFDDNGEQCRVENVSDIMYGHDVYEVEFIDGSVLKADGGHLWTTSDVSSRKSAERSTGGGYSAYHKTFQKSQRTHFDCPKTTVEILRSLHRKDGRNNHAISISAPIVLGEKDLPMDPYLLGYWLGDGDSNCANLTVHKKDLYNIIDNLDVCEERYSVRNSSDNENIVRVSFGSLATCKRGHDLKYQSSGGCSKCATKRYRCKRDNIDFRDEYPLTHFSSTEVLRHLDVIENKHIPVSYLRASIDQRWEILKGLMDTDGTAGKNGHVSFCSSNKVLMSNFYELVCSLGMKCKVVYKAAKFGGKEFPSEIAHFSATECPFKLYRKKVRWKLPKKGTKNRSIIDVRKIDSEPVRCIQVSSTSKLFLVGKSMIPTHNSLLGWEIIKQAQMLDLGTCYWDIEKQYSPEFTEYLGVNLEKMKREDAEIIEDIAEELQLLLGSVHVHVLDSCSEAKPQAMIERDPHKDAIVALKIRTWEKAWEYIMKALDKQENVIIAIDHAKSTFAPGAPGGRIAEKPLGGKEIEHASSLSLQLHKTKWLYYDDEEMLQSEDKLKEKGILGVAGQKEADGQELVVKVAKSRVCRPFRTAILRLDLNTYKFDHTFEYMQGAEYYDKEGNIAHRSGTPAIAQRGASKQDAWVSLPNGEKVQGERALRQMIDADQDLRRLIRRAMLVGN